MDALLELVDIDSVDLKLISKDKVLPILSEKALTEVLLRKWAYIATMNGAPYALQRGINFGRVGGDRGLAVCTSFRFASDPGDGRRTGARDDATHAPNALLHVP